MCNNSGRFQKMSCLVYNVVATRLSGESMTTDGNTSVNYYVQKFIYEVLNNC
jgi:hypothetical protein